MILEYGQINSRVRTNHFMSGYTCMTNITPVDDPRHVWRRLLRLRLQAGSDTRHTPLNVCTINSDGTHVVEAVSVDLGVEAFFWGLGEGVDHLPGLFSFFYISKRLVLTSSLR